MAEQLKDADPKTKQQLLDKAKEMAKDPKGREALEEMLKSAAKNPQTKESLEKMLKDPRAPKKPNLTRQASREPAGPKSDRNDQGKPTDPGPNAGTTKALRQANAPASKTTPRRPGRQLEGSLSRSQGTASTGRTEQTPTKRRQINPRPPNRNP